MLQKAKGPAAWGADRTSNKNALLKHRGVYETRRPPTSFTLRAVSDEAGRFVCLEVVHV